MKAEERYQHDPMFKALVDSLYSSIESLHLTPTEVREVAMLACIKFEQMRPRAPLLFSSGQRAADEDNEERTLGKPIHPPFRSLDQF